MYNPFNRKERGEKERGKEKEERITKTGNISILQSVPLRHFDLGQSADLQYSS